MRPVPASRRAADVPGAAWRPSELFVVNPEEWGISTGE